MSKKQKKKAPEAPAAAVEKAAPDATRPKPKKKVYEKELARLQVELVKMQEWI